MTDTPNVLTPTIAVNNAINAAVDLPDLKAKLEKVSPELSAQLENKALIASKTPWGTG